jgi:hypothetical protein
VKLPPPVHSTVREIYKLHEAAREREPERDYLGGSEIGQPCKRRLWLSFRHAEREDFDGRMLRLFGTGHREEARLIAELRAAGMTVSDRDDRGQQHEVVACGGHVKGHLDGALLGLVEAPKTWHLLECKTHNAKSYADVVKRSVSVAKPLHYAQMIFYMGLAGIARGAYFAINKDTDHIHLERIEFEQAEFDRLMGIASATVFSNEPPPRISEDASWFECRYCPFIGLCHGNQVPLPNCRTCAHSTPMNGGTWQCAQHGQTVDFPTQQAGCPDHRYIPALVDRVLELVGAEGNEIAWRIIPTGALIRQPEFLSTELRNAPNWEFPTTQWAQDYKRIFGARIAPSRGDAWEPPRVETGDAPKSDVPF